MFVSSEVVGYGGIPDFRAAGARLACAARMRTLLLALAVLSAPKLALAQTVLAPEPDQPTMGESSRGLHLGGLGYLNPGFLYAFGLDGHESLSGPGLELSYMNFPSHHAWDTGYGAFGNVLFYGKGDRRYAFGLQYGSLLGLEAGFAYRTAHDESRQA